MNSSAKLTDAELREAAAEAGISPEELRRALAERHSDLPATIDTPSGVLASTSLETRLALPPEHAGETVRRLLERRSDWLRIALPDGEQGWIPADQAAVVHW